MRLHGFGCMGHSDAFADGSLDITGLQCPLPLIIDLLPRPQLPSDSGLLLLHLVRLFSVFCSWPVSN